MQLRSFLRSRKSQRNTKHLFNSPYLAFLVCIRLTHHTTGSDPRKCVDYQYPYASFLRPRSALVLAYYAAPSEPVGILRL
jgi:hypothetical protein